MPRPKPPPPPPKPPRRPAGSGTVGVRSNGRVFVVLPPDLDPGRKAIYGPGSRKAFDSAEVATAWLDAEIIRRRTPTMRSARRDEPLGSYLARWFANHSPGWPERTASAYAASLRRWHVIGDVPIGDLTREVVQGGVAELSRATWQRKRKDGTPTSEPKPYSRRTIAQAVTILHQALEDLVPDVVRYNPARLRRRSRRTADPEQPVWSAEHVERFLEVAERVEPRLALGYRLILRRALRTGEAVDLSDDDVDEAASVLRVDETPGLKRGTSGPTKTRRIRDVPLSAGLAARIRAHRQAYPSTDRHLFLINGERVSISHFRDRWLHCVRLAKLPRITPKDGRATCATLLLDRGWPLPVVSQLLGHTDIATTARFYARVIKRRAEQTAQLAEQLDATLEPPADAAAGEAAGS